MAVPWPAVPLAETAQHYLSLGLSVFPVGRDKHPLVEWKSFQTDLPHADQVDVWWTTEYPEANIGVATGQVSGLVVLDSDGADGQAALNAILSHEQGVPTWRSLTARGAHMFFKHPGADVRIHNRTGLRPHLDVRGDGGYVVVPPSRHASGAHYEWVSAPGDVPLAAIPGTLLRLLLTPDPNTGLGPAGPIPDGQRNDTLYRLARSLFVKRLSRAGVLSALLAENAERCRPPLARTEIEDIVRKAEAQPHRPDFTGPVPTVAPIAPPEASALTSVPEAGVVGLGREFADLYAQYLESPRAFFYFTYLTYFGSLVARKVTLETELRPQPRLYTVLLGETTKERKSTALRKADEFFRSLGEPWAPRVLFGVGSAEGIAAEFKRAPELLLHFDELKGFVDKAKNEHSVAMPMVNTLFERNDYDNRTKTERLEVRDAALSLVAACTGDTYSTVFDRKFLAIGFPNRLWLVSDQTTRQVAMPPTIPDAALAALRDKTIAALARIDELWRAHGQRPVAYRLTPGALRAFEGWYAARTGSIFERRLDTYAHRLLVLLAATTAQTLIDEELVARVVALLGYQLEVRRRYDPVDADNAVATMEEQLRRALAKGALSKRELQKRVHYERAGLWIWEQAVGHLIKAGEAQYDPSRTLYWLGES